MQSKLTKPKQFRNYTEEKRTIVDAKGNTVPRYRFRWGPGFAEQGTSHD